ncbi:MAG TPA: SGNH/GDSL hydrolase family protein [Acidimicrobiales bacterium]|nr:SGNH/GDSL hydrolase family protein [Acidimicrobiales bacterium]
MDRRRFLQGAGVGAGALALGAPAASAVAAPSLSGLTTLNMKAENFPHWHQAVANVKARKSSSKVLFVGTSITFGAGVGFKFPTQSVPAYFAQLAHAAIAPATQSLGAITPVTPHDSRFSVGSGWYAEGGGPGLGWADVGYIAGNPGAGSLTFTPAPKQKVDTFDLWYIGGPTSGSMEASVNGARATTIHTTMKGGIRVTKTTIRCKAGTSNVLSVNSVTKGTVFLFAIDAYRASAAALHIGNAGVSGLGSAKHWATASVGSSLACLEAYRPSLTVIALGGDDALLTGPPTSAAAFTKSVQSLIGAAKRSGDVLLWTEPLSVPGALVSVPAEQSFASALYRLAAANNVGLVDIAKLFVSGPSAASRGLFYDQYHPNKKGNALIAKALAESLATVA